MERCSIISIVQLVESLLSGFLLSLKNITYTCAVKSHATHVLLVNIWHLRVCTQSYRDCSKEEGIIGGS